MGGPAPGASGGNGECVGVSASAVCRTAQGVRMCARTVSRAAQRVAVCAIAVGGEVVAVSAARQNGNI